MPTNRFIIYGIVIILLGLLSYHVTFVLISKYESRIVDVFDYEIHNVWAESTSSTTFVDTFGVPKRGRFLRKLHHEWFYLTTISHTSFYTLKHPEKGFINAIALPLGQPNYVPNIVKAIRANTQFRFLIDGIWSNCTNF
jgi:hypothetical protein